MTEDQLYAYRLHARIYVLETVVQQLLRAMVSGPEAKASLEAWAAKARANSVGVKFPGADPAVSDMLAGEYQETVDRFFKDLLA